MRAYCWGNFYLSSIQQGIQSAHALVEMFAHITPTTPEGVKLYEWARQHKTMICLSGGNAEDLIRRQSSLMAACKMLRLPCAAFYEDKASLNESITCVTCIVPEELYSDTPTDRAALRAKIVECNYETPLDASFDQEFFSASERLRLLMMDCRLAG